MRRWIAERLDDAVFPFLKLIGPGFRRRMAPFREAKPCEVGSLGQIRPPEVVELWAERPWRGCEVQGIRFRSPLNCFDEEHAPVSGRLIRTRADAPWCVIVPGFAAGALATQGYAFYQEAHARQLVQRGINAALIDLPFHMSRRRPGSLSGEGFFGPDLHNTKAAVRQGAADVIALIRWLQATSGSQVGAWATSMGGCIAGLVATQVRDLTALVLMEPLDNPGDPMASHPSTWEIREEIRRHGVAPEGIPAALRDVAPSSYRPVLPPERILFVTPKWDRVVYPRFQERFWEAWGRPPRMLYDLSHTTLAANPAVTAAAADFLAAWLSPQRSH